MTPQERIKRAKAELEAAEKALNEAENKLPPIKVGQVWRTKKGELVVITSYFNGRLRWALPNGGCADGSDASSGFLSTDHDLIEYIGTIEDLVATYQAHGAIPALQDCKDAAEVLKYYKGRKMRWMGSKGSMSWDGWAPYAYFTPTHTDPGSKSMLNGTLYVAKLPPREDTFFFSKPSEWTLVDD